MFSRRLKRENDRMRGKVGSVKFVGATYRASGGLALLGEEQITAFIRPTISPLAGHRDPAYWHVLTFRRSVGTRPALG